VSLQDTVLNAAGDVGGESGDSYFPENLDGATHPEEKKEEVRVWVECLWWVTVWEG
jgi:hypothetical protein